MPDNPDLELGAIPRGGATVRVGKRFRLTLTLDPHSTWVVYRWGYRSQP
jgi:hypothetical protein